MAVSFVWNQQSSDKSLSHTCCPSLYAAFTVARLVQSFKRYLKSRVVEPKPLGQSPIASFALSQPPRQRTIVDSPQEQPCHQIGKDIHESTLPFDEHSRGGEDTLFGDRSMTISPQKELKDELSK